MQITLLRHGRPSFELKGTLRASELRDTKAAYDASSIINTPDQAVIDHAVCHNIAVCSHLPRAISSARALGIDKIHVTDSLFREADLPYFDGGHIRLPIDGWVTLYRLLSLFGFAHNGESMRDTKRRAGDAALRLIELATEHQSVLLVGHGFINLFIAKVLLADNWRGPTRPGSNFWDFSVYTKGPSTHSVAG